MRTGWRRAAARARRRRPAWSTRPSPADLTYGGALFDRAGAFVRSRAAGRPASDVDPAETDGPATDRGWWTDLAGAVALCRLALFLPAEDVRLTASPSGDALRAALAGRTLGVPRNRICAAVFAVPEQVPDRPTGKRNQALRTALTAAARAGLRVRPVHDRTERRDIAADAARRVPRLESWSRTAPELPGHDWWVAEDADGVVVGVATVVADVEWASLVTLFSLPGRGVESPARFLLHHSVVRALSGAGVRRLAVLDHSPLLLARGPRHLQRVLGYRPVRLRRPVTVGEPAVVTTRPHGDGELRPSSVSRRALPEVPAGRRARV